MSPCSFIVFKFCSYMNNYAENHDVDIEMQFTAEIVLRWC